MGFLKYRRVKNPNLDLNVNVAECELQDAMLTQFKLSFEEELYATVDRLERDEAYSEAVAEATREEIDTSHPRVGLFGF